MSSNRMDWSKLLTETRVGVEKGTDTDLRSEHVRDYDRIVFSNAFHRLGRKTQVHPLAENDHVHNRLTHSIEVSTVGRSIAYLVGKDIETNNPKDIPLTSDGNKDDEFILKLTSIAQAACVAHDIGNSPFGHAGEHAIREWFSTKFSDQNHFLNKHIEEDKKNDFKIFEGNAQGFRICSHYDISHKEHGLQLTYATLGAMIKYPWVSNISKAGIKEKFNIYKDEEEIFYKLVDELGLIKKSVDEIEYARHPIAFIVEAADDICYKIIDIEDAIELGAITYNNLEYILKESNLDRVLFNEISDYDKLSNKTKMSRIRSKAIGYLIEAVKREFINNYDLIMGGECDIPLLDLAEKTNEGIANLLEKLKILTNEKVFKIPRKIEIEVGSYSTMEILLDAFIPAVEDYIKNKGKISFKNKRILDLMEDDFDKSNVLQQIEDKEIDDMDEIYYKSFMRAMDYISGMTDNYATYIAKQISGDAN
ncbi:deoxyguanosinetriphosphate triphosphohydrolase [Celerinatantimonas diazotrophica]|uniref:dGTPase n=1 Tax=Celerinatantimonas diazotrophica TaxID=412034 RepID=A0A4V2PSU8_9GAMM|nr:deoxyguanosinetriphosphate triphosphohydrolase [Celerinatantimonas diazotrophica]TCK63981.1 dGTPase [Celerinatantimonas diazotrophica]CAG9297068.1 Deoxyguanosinetriphosphate triphosphohydrolase [Celerinatantimonas diazotrophica]